MLERGVAHSGTAHLFDRVISVAEAGSFKLGPGDSLHAIGDQPHHWANETAKPAGAVWFALCDN